MENPKKSLGDAKCPMHLLPPAFLRQTAMAIKDGARKYGDFNWRKTNIDAQTYIGAMLRHITSWAEQVLADDFFAMVPTASSSEAGAMRLGLPGVSLTRADVVRLVLEQTLR